MPPRKPYFLAAALWLAMVVVFFWPVILQDKVIAPLDIVESLLRPWATSEKIEVHNAFTYDAISQYLPYDYSVYQSLQQDGYTGWNPYTHSGSSIVENTMICPGDWHHHLYRFLSFWTAWNAGILLQFTLAGLGMLLLLRDQKIPAAYALIGVVAFAFYSQFILWIQHRWVLGAMCWAPWILWSLFRAKKAGRIVDLPSVAFIALAFRGGHLQACVFVVLLVAFIALAEWWEHPEKWRIKPVFQILLPYGVSGVFARDSLPRRVHRNDSSVSPRWQGAIGASVVQQPHGSPYSRHRHHPHPDGFPPRAWMSPDFFGVSLFSIKFAGAFTLIMAALACLKRQAPTAAKLLFLLGLILPFTPADQWVDTAASP